MYRQKYYHWNCYIIIGVSTGCFSYYLVTHELYFYYCLYFISIFNSLPPGELALSRCFHFTRTQSFTGSQSSVVFSDDLLYWWLPPPTLETSMSEFPLVSSVLGLFACDTLTISLNPLQSREKRKVISDIPVFDWCAHYKNLSLGFIYQNVNVLIVF